MKKHVKDVLLYEEKEQAYQIKQAFLKLHNKKRKQRPIALYAVLFLFLSAFLFM